MSSPLPAEPAEHASIHIDFANTFARLPSGFHARLHPTPVAAPRLIQLNVDLARALRLDPDALATPEGVAILAGNQVATGSEPLAGAYAGHQFGHFVPQLGDGRAILLGEVVGRDGSRYDIQLKGAGPTPFSRGGDGRAALGPVLREYIVSEAMAALGVPTTRALAAVATGQSVFRESVLPGAVLTRVAASHVRVGTFQYFAVRRDVDSLHILADYAIARHDPEAATAPRPYRALLDGVIARQASLVAQWLMLGFIHGVMNTDNTSISGETIDYGPCAFMEAFEPDKVFSSIDRRGRYAYANQPHAMGWNLTRLAEALLPLLGSEEGNEEGALVSANEALAGFMPRFEAARAAGLRAKLGLGEAREGDVALAEGLLEQMAANQADFTLTFRRLCDAAENPAEDAAVASLFARPAAFHEWVGRWHGRLAGEVRSAEERAATMRRCNPAYIPRNHLVQAVIEAATERQDFAPLRKLVDVGTEPYRSRPGLEQYERPARPEECVRETFCGT